MYQNLWYYGRNYFTSSYCGIMGVFIGKSHQIYVLYICGKTGGTEIIQGDPELEA